VERALRCTLGLRVSGKRLALHEKARRLFTTNSKRGDPGELMLYLLAEHSLKYPQFLCKFPLKTAPNVYAHGAAGLRASAILLQDSFASMGKSKALPKLERTHRDDDRLSPP